MKKFLPWIQGSAIIVLIIDWIVIGLRLVNGNYNIKAGAYIALVCIWIVAICAIGKLFFNRCPYCGKVLWLKGKYCPCCGKEITK